MTQPEFDFERALRILADGGVKFIIVGGVASAMNGAVLATLDLDIVPSRDPENLEKLAPSSRVNRRDLPNPTGPAI